MKFSLFLSLAVVCSAPAVRAADVEVTMAALRKIGYLPQDKAELRPEDKLDIKRKNPFAERKKVVAAKPTEQVETEESKLRFFFDKQQVSGLMKMPGDKWIVTMGRLSLEAGKILPPIIPNQTHILRVIKVTDSDLEIGWVEDSGVGPDPAIPRKIRKKIDLRPKVYELIVSEDNAGEKAQTYAKDETGKVMVPRQNVLPNPSDLLDQIPPGSDTSPGPVLTEQEQKELHSVETGSPPPAPAPQPAPVPDAVPPADGTPAAPENPEDSVQPDPDLADPNAAPGTTPAGPPGR